MPIGLSCILIGLPNISVRQNWLGKESSLKMEANGLLHHIQNKGKIR